MINLLLEMTISKLTVNTFRSNSHLLAILLGIAAFMAGHSLLPGEQTTGDLSGLPEVQQRYESMLLRSPGPGRAFEEVFQYHFAHDSLEELKGRWISARDSKANHAYYKYGLLLALLESKLGNQENCNQILSDLTGRYPSEYQPCLLLARSLTDLGFLNEAEKYFQMAIDRGLPPPDELDVYRELALVQQRNFNQEGALKTWKTLLDAYAGDPDIKEEVAAALAESDFFDEALVYYHEIEAESDGDLRRRLRVILKQADIEEIKGDFLASVNHYRRALSLSAPGGWVYREIMANVEGLFSRRDNLEGYADFLQNRLDTYPQELETALLLAEMKFRLGREEKSLEIYSNLAEAAPGRTDVQFAYGKALLHSQKFGEAAAIINALKEKKPDSWEYRQALGEVYWREYESGNDETLRSRAISEWAGLLELQTRRGAQPAADFLVQIGDLFRQYGIDDEAAAYYRMAIESTPDSFDLRERLALFYFSIDRKLEAWEVLESFPPESAGVEYYLRVAQFQKQYGRSARALESIDRGLALKPDNYPLRELRWRLLIETSQWTLAIAEFDAICSAAPNEFVLNDLETRYIQLLRTEGSLSIRKDAMLGDLEARVAGQGDFLAENKLRVLVRMVLSDSQPQLAREILEKAQNEYPDSFLLARLQADFWKNYGNLDQQIQAWRNLIRIRPLRKAEWLQQIVMAYRQQNLWPEAIKAAQEYLDTFPADSQAYQLYADICFDAGKVQDGTNSLKTAIRLADNTFPLKLRLAREFYDQSRFEDAREEYEDAFFEADTLEQRQSVIQPLVELHLAEGTLDQLIRKFQKKLRNRLASWEYHLYLADIFLQAEDLKQARDSLQQALQFRPDDVKLLRRVIRLAREENKTDEWVKFAFRLSQVEPSPENEIALAQALFYDGKREEAATLLNANLQDMAGNAANFSDLLPILAELDIFYADGETQESAFMQVEQMDSKLLFSAASVFIIKGKIKEAENLLWEILNRQYEVVTHPGLSADTPEGYQQRISRVGQIRRDFQQLTTLSSAVDFKRFNASFSPRNLTDSQMAALIYLSGLASINDEQDAFLEKLGNLLDELETPAAERAMCYLQIQARLQFLHEIRNLIEAGDYESDLYVFLHEILGNTVRHPSAGQDKEAMQQIMYQLEDQMMAFEPDQAAQVFISEVNKYLQVGAVQDAETYLGRIQANSDRMNSDTAFQLAQLYVKSGSAEDCRAYLQLGLEKADDSELQAAAGQQSLPLDSIILQYAQKIVRENAWDSSDGEMLARLALLHIRRKMKGSESTSTSQGSLDSLMRFPLPTRYTDHATIAFLRQLSLTLNTVQVGDFYQAAVRGASGKLDSEEDVAAQLIMIYESFWAGDSGKAQESLRAMVADQADTGDVTLNLLLGQLLTEENENREALILLEKTGRLSRDLEVLRLLLLFQNAKSVGDDAIVKASLRELLLFQPVRLSGFSLSNEMQRYGMAQELQQVTPNISRNKISRQSRTTLRNEINQLIARKNYDEAELLCRQGMNDNAPGPRKSQGDAVRQECLKRLLSMKRLGAYINELETQLTATPDSVQLIHRLMEAFDVQATGESGQRIVKQPVGNQPEDDRVRQLLRRLVELRPNEDFYLDLYAGDLRKKRDLEELSELYLKRLRQDFENAFRKYQDLPDVLISQRKEAALLKMLDEFAVAQSSGSTSIGMRYQLATPLLKLGQALQQNNRHEESIRVWEYSLTLLPPDRSGDIRKLLLQEYLSAGAVEKATDLLAGYFLAQRLDVSRSMWFGRIQPVQPHAWLQHTQPENNQLTLPSLKLLREIQSHEAVKQSLINLTREKQDNGSGEEALLASAFLTALVFVDPTDGHRQKLKEVTQSLINLLESDESLKNSSLGYLVSSNLFSVLNNDIPDSDSFLPLKQRLVKTSLSAWDRNSRNFGQRISGRFKLLDLYERSGNEEEMKTVARDLALIMNEQFVARRGMINVDEGFRLLEELIELSLFREASVWLNELKTSNRVAGNRSNLLVLLRHEQELDLLTGQNRFPVARVWIDQSGSDGPESPVKLFWEIGPKSVVDEKAPQPASMLIYGRTYEILEGQFDLQLVLESESGSRRRLASLESVAPRGQLDVLIGEQKGIVFGRLVTRTQPPLSIDGTKFPFLRSPNLIQAPLPGNNPVDKGIYTRWNLLNSMTVKEVGGGVDGDEVCLALSTTQNRERTIKSPVLNLSPGNSYEYSLWIKRKEKNRAELKWLFLDKKGRILGESGLSVHASLPGLWTRFTGMLAGGEDSPENASRMPTGTVAVQITLKVRGHVEIDGLYLGTLPVVEEEIP